MPSVHKKDLESKLLQNADQGNPIDARRLHGRCSQRHNYARLWYPVEICSEARKASYWFGIPVGANRYVATPISGILDEQPLALDPPIAEDGKFFLCASTRLCA